MPNYNAITVIIPYYRQPKLLQLQLDVFAQYTVPDFGVIIVDDGSCAVVGADRRWCARTVLSGNRHLVKKLRLRLLEILQDVSWNMMEASNLGMQLAATKWVLFKDVDHFMSPTSFSHLDAVRRNENWNVNYVFRRTSDGKVPPNIYCASRLAVLKAGFYDEDFAGSRNPSDRPHNKLLSNLLKVEVVDKSMLYVVKHHEEYGGVITDRNISFMADMERDMLEVNITPKSVLRYAW
eukprot:CAMPEP_0172545772 /NCGR_PEP_ID=MMETSP1067-20121228/15627_1 /TAXON_ID=265564 ORGANISM="Thalassiosira punctigera, Strain Tpunct2005C2" /NCGR_SAMPLE_ID=MMETSP1067 /ASSEMBLY_ACC=CAM_ASM_000444 /LENGTH=235 /DNA_ID=CAMNT_0013332587 /DNA_START=444 /DNA_END=1148 /DNA_ORIENTATION=-